MYQHALRCICFASLFSVAALTFAAPGATMLVAEGKPVAVLVLPAQPDQDEKLAAAEIQQHVEKISGVRLEIVAPDKKPPEMTRVLIGAAAPVSLLDQIRKQGNDPAAFALTVDDNRLCLRGLSPEGTLFAAYELLEQLGVRWFMPGELGTVVPQAATIRLQRQATVQTPSFGARWIDADRAWSRRMRLGGPYFPCSHGLPGLQEGDAAALMKTKPEVFALVGGRRTAAQACLSNPETLRIVVAATQKALRDDPTLSWIGMGPNDGADFCQCDKCRALDAGDWDPFSNEPSMSDRYVWFFNQILDGIKDEFPHAKLGFYAYHTYMRPPRKVKPSPRIVPALAPIALCRIHGPNNPVCPEKSYYRWLVAEWGKLLPEVYDRGYWFNLADPGFPFPMMHCLREQIPLGKQLGIKGWRVETLNHWAAESPSLYVACKLMWNHRADVDALVRDYCERFFGPAGKPMRQYAELMNAAMRDADFHTGSSFDMPHIYPAAVRVHARTFLNDAGQRAGNGLYQERVRIVAADFDYLEAFISMLDHRARHDWVAAKADLDQIDRLRGQLLAVKPSMLSERAATSYLQRFFRVCTEQGYARVTAGNRLAAPLADRWQFQIDPSAIGEDLGWWRKDSAGGNWQPIRTATASWSDQGLRYYKGLAWCRQTVVIPAEFKGQRIFLWFGGVDDKAKVWLNGKLLGVSHNAVFVPFEFDATAAARPGGKNHLAVLVSNKAVDELGTGGIMAPAMFYAPTAGKKAVPENVEPLGRTFP
jgi:hypothetical protein